MLRSIDTDTVVQVKDIIDKLSSYNIFNYLFPGFVFVIILKESSSYIHSPEFTVQSIVVIYFIGLVLSRIGSLIIEGLLLQLRLIKPIDTQTYIEKIKDNTRLEILFEAMNMYRTLSSMSLILSLMTFADILSKMSHPITSLIYCYLEFLLFILFTFAFCKQRNKVLECLLPKDSGILAKRDDLTSATLKFFTTLKSFLKK